ncbi:MAG TPA: O-antigen ligase family protein [Phycisphaerae bacterium]|nr:O-antigen ligase family protein [Phycisphaerae bacterium]
MTGALRSPVAGPSPVARRLEWAALLCILAVLVARCFISEMPFRISELSTAPTPESPYNPPDELLRLIMATALLAAALLWALARAVGPRATIRGPVMALGVIAFAGWSLLSARGAVDARGALTAWLEQVAILAAAVAMLNLAGDGRKWALVVVVLAALAGTMGVKAVFEVLVEVPERIGQFQADKVAQLARAGLRPGSPGARMFERRLTDPSALGFVALANVFASLLVVLSAAGAALAVEKFADARKRPLPQPREPGEISLPLLAAVVTLLLPAGGVAALILTRSKGGIAAGAISALTAAAVVLGRRVLARHRRKVLTACGGALVAAVMAVAVLGVNRGGLPSRSMQVRWEYWVGGAGVVAESPWTGVGPGNFGHAYLRHRLPEAAESTKTAHNVLVDAACNYGLVGAAIYLALLGGMLAAMTRPGGEPSPIDHARAGPPPAAVIAMLAAVAAAARGVVAGATDPALLFLEAFLPAAVFAAMGVLATWAGDSLGADRLPGRRARIVLGCGVAGFALHNLITYTLWAPGPATVFWIAAAAVAGAGVGGWTPRVPTPVRWALTAALAAGIVAAAVVLVRPVWRRTALVREVSGRLVQRRGLDAVRALSDAADADPLDGITPADLARLLLAWQEGAHPATFPSAVKAAQTAWRRSPTATHADLLSRALGDDGRAVDMAAEAVRLDPMNPRLRIRHAAVLLAHERPDDARAQLQRARALHDALPADSDLRLNDEELRELEELFQKIR